MSSRILTRLLVSTLEVWLEGNDKVGDKCVFETLASDVECRVLYLFTDAMNPAVVSFDVEEKSV